MHRFGHSCFPSQGYTHSVLLNFLLRQERAVFQDIPKSTDICCDRVLPQSCNKTQGEREYVFMFKLLWAICERARVKLGLSFFFPSGVCGVTYEPACRLC